MHGIIRTNNSIGQLLSLGMADDYITTGNSHFSDHTVKVSTTQKYLQRYDFLLKKNPDSEGDVSQFGALATSLAATIGTGNIIGVATAVAFGGPGAVFWCWLTGVFGIATKYAEGLLAIKYRVKTSSGEMLGGPMYALERGMKQKWLGIFILHLYSHGSIRYRKYGTS